MKLVIVALALVAVALAAPPQGAPQGAPKPVSLIVRSEFDKNPDGGYVFSFETDDGTKRDETGEVKTVNDEENKPQEVVVQRGVYSFTDIDGKVHTTTYYADETGFHAEGDDIPKAPARR